MRGFSTPRHPRRAGARPDHRRGHHPDLPVVHLRAGRRRGTRAGGYEYARSGNPTRTALQECLAALEGGRHARAFASGMAAERRAAARPAAARRPRRDPARRLRRHVPAGRQGARAWGIEYTPVDLGRPRRRCARRCDRPRGWCGARRRRTRCCGIADIAARSRGRVVGAGRRAARGRQHLRLALPAAAARARRGRRRALDDEVPRRALRRGRRRARHRRQRAGRAAGVHQNAVGRGAGPVRLLATLRGVKTLAVRMERHSDNAERVADMLDEHPAVSRVLYPGLPEHPGHEVAAKQMRGFGGMVSFLLAGGGEAALRVCAATELFTLAESLGGVESLVEHPGADDARLGGGLGAGGARRRSCACRSGIEDADDLVEDLRTALERAAVGRRRGSVSPAAPCAGPAGAARGRPPPGRCPAGAGRRAPRPGPRPAPPTGPAA